MVFFFGTTMVIFQNWTFDYLIVVTVNFHIQFDAQQGLVHFGVYPCFVGGVVFKILLCQLNLELIPKSNSLKVNFHIYFLGPQLYTIISFFL